MNLLGEIHKIGVTIYSKQHILLLDRIAILLWNFDQLLGIGFDISLLCLAPSRWYFLEGLTISMSHVWRCHKLPSWLSAFNFILVNQRRHNLLRVASCFDVQSKDSPSAQEGALIAPEPSECTITTVTLRASAKWGPTAACIILRVIFLWSLPMTLSHQFEYYFAFLLEALLFSRP